MATHTQLALCITTPQTQSGRMAIHPPSTPHSPTTTGFSDGYDDGSTLPNNLYCTSHKLHALTVLRDLTKSTRASYDAARRLRSGQYSDLEVYAIRRMATSLEEPGRSRAIHIINEALKYRNLTPPKTNQPLTIPFLTHDTFQHTTPRWLTTLLHQRKQHAIPFHLQHLPPTATLSSPFSTKRQCFTTFQKAMTKWLKHNGLPPALTHLADHFLAIQWQQHFTTSPP